VLNVTATATCTGSYVPVATGDSCDDIAKANSISTDALLQINGLPGGCAGFPNNMTSLCVQGSCTPRIVEANDTCASLAAEAGATVVQLLAWNTGIDPLCINLDKQVGHVICLSNPLGYTALASASVGGAPTGATTAATLPTDAAAQSNTNCGLWYEVNPGDCEVFDPRVLSKYADIFCRLRLRMHQKRHFLE
jgi:LysM repeat protein